MLRKHNSWVLYLSMFLLAAAFMLIYNGVAGSWTELSSYCDGAFIGGAIVFLLGIMIIVDNYGGLDLVSYMFAKKDPVTHRKKDYYLFVEERKQKHEGKNYLCIPFFIIGAVYMLFAVITYAIIGF